MYLQDYVFQLLCMQTSLRPAVFCNDELNEKEGLPQKVCTIVLCVCVQNLRQLDLTNCSRLVNLPSAMAGEMCLNCSLSPCLMRINVKQRKNYLLF